MNHLHPTQYHSTGQSSRSLSSGSQDSSSSYSTRGISTPSTSPALSDPGMASGKMGPDGAASWSQLPESSAQPGLSPLELLVQRGQQVQHDIMRPEVQQAVSGKSRIYERATALSRKTSVRRPPVQPSPEPEELIDDGDDDTRSLRSINLNPSSQSASTFSVSRRAPVSRSPYMHNGQWSGHGHGHGNGSSSVASGDDGGPRRFDDGASWQDQSNHLLNNAFRSSIASDISFNSITDAAERMSIAGDDYHAHLSRRPSTDTVRSSEFGEDGRWGRAWNTRADDEESAYEESAYGDIDDGEDEQGYSRNRDSLLQKEVLIDGPGGAYSRTGGLNSIAAQWKAHHTTQYSETTSSASAYASRVRQNEPDVPAIQDVQSKEKIVNLTRSVPVSQMLRPDAHQSLTPNRHSFVPEIETEDYDTIDAATYRSSITADQTPLAQASRQMGHRHTDSSSTITGSSSSTGSSPASARVYVYPPSPSGSEASRNGGASYGDGNGYASAHDAVQRGSYGAIPEAISAQVETLPDSPALSGTSRPSGPKAPVAPANLLAQPRNSPLIGPNARKSKISGHPAGRAPPPPPPAHTQAHSQAAGSSLDGYGDPNQYFQGVDRPIFGRMRSEAIARADGRESMVSDLDVETLRLDGSSRRDSASTIASVMSSRMSIGTTDLWPPAAPAAHSNPTSPGVVQQPFAPQQQQPERPQLETKQSQASFRSLQSVQSMEPPLGASYSNAAAATAPLRPAALRNAKSTNTLATVSSLADTISSVKTSKSSESASPAIDTRTGPTSAEDFLSKGITYHEQGDLARSAFYFERSAKVDGGCVVGMCMFGMALREGWGARKDPVKGFSWIQRAASKAGDMMSSASASPPRSDSELKAIKSELKLSVYELAKCFCYGWGVKMDKHMALEYFELAAKLGDPDAQAEAGALYAAGKGCKKDLKKAAYYYKLAEQGGYDTVGLSWIHKDKYK
ncbi:hypothetical protein BCV70DRAFT_191320 [Testicularia cyperi]|uniref:HCP-like protein n=1 Tax=Testicularia cyperi TaxID=1882483 RepID=A0A317XND4_9BASI|nr:hypothetical protein BCV70DRAFT_191320 [Testicularia cyperi]